LKKREGHLKTTSVNYDLNTNDSFAHLTNYSVQKYHSEFSKFHIGNEVSFKDFQKALSSNHKTRFVTVNDIFMKIQDIIKISFKSVDLIF